MSAAGGWLSGCGPWGCGRAAFQGHYAINASPPRSTQLSAAGLYRRGSPPEVGDRHHLPLDGQRLAVSGGHWTFIPDPWSAWSMVERITQDLVMAHGLVPALPPHGLILHSDRGSQYAVLDYQALLEQQSLLCSMSRKGDCYDHAAMPSFFHTLKYRGRVTRPGQWPEPMPLSTSKPTTIRKAAIQPSTTGHPGSLRTVWTLNEVGVQNKVARSLIILNRVRIAIRCLLLHANTVLLIEAFQAS